MQRSTHLHHARWPATRLLLLATGAAVCAVLMGSAPRPAVSAAAPVDDRRVLILASREWPTIQHLRAELRAGGRGDPPLPPIETEFVAVSSADQTTAALRKLKPVLGRYRAIYSSSQTYARAAQGEVPATMPIVFDGVDDPVALCLVDKLSRPGRNATGHMHLLQFSEEKMLQTLHDAFPDLREVVVLVSSGALAIVGCEGTVPPPPPPAEAAAGCRSGPRPLDDYVRLRIGPQMPRNAARLGLRPVYFVLCEGQGFGTLAGQGRPGVGFFVPWQTQFDDQPQALVDTLNATGRPAIYPRDTFAQRGGLMSLQVENDAIAERASVLAMLRVLGGHDPATLPVSSPRGMRLTINALTAQRTGNFPSLAAWHRADEVLRGPPRP